MQLTLRQENYQAGNAIESLEASAANFILGVVKNAPQFEKVQFHILARRKFNICDPSFSAMDL